jgi:hypothetical protein
MFCESCGSRAGLNHKDAIIVQHPLDLAQCLFVEALVGVDHVPQPIVVLAAGGVVAENPVAGFDDAAELVADAGVDSLLLGARVESVVDS